MDSDESYTFLTTFFNNIRSQNFEEEDISGICSMFIILKTLINILNLGMFRRNI